jgi:hypothetical protein
MRALFWTSIALWMVALFAYAVILSGHARSHKYLYRTLVLSAIAAMLTGGLYMVVAI